MYRMPAPTQEAGYDDEDLVPSLNALLTALRIPITVISPTDLTPTLLLAIVENMLQIRIPLMLDESVDPRGFTARLQKVKIFLGVFEHDILQADAGFSTIDPRSLVYGDWKECVYIAQLLCFAGRNFGLIDDEYDDDDDDDAFSTEDDNEINHRNSSSSQAGSKPTQDSQINTAARASSRRHAHDESSAPSLSGRTFEIDTDDPDNDEKLSSLSYSSLNHLSAFISPASSPRRPPRCIHEVPSPSLIIGGLDRDSPSPTLSSPASVDTFDRTVTRHHSLLPSTPPHRAQISLTSSAPYPVSDSEPVDGDVNEDSENEFWERGSSRLLLSSSPRFSRHAAIDGHEDDPRPEEMLSSLLAQSSELARTLELLEIRAQLLSELNECDVVG